MSESKTPPASERCRCYCHKWNGGTWERCAVCCPPAPAPENDAVLERAEAENMVPELVAALRARVKELEQALYETDALCDAAEERARRAERALDLASTMTSDAERQRDTAEERAAKAHVDMETANNGWHAAASRLRTARELLRRDVPGFDWRDGEPRYRTHNGIPQEIPTRTRNAIKKWRREIDAFLAEEE